MEIENENFENYIEEIFFLMENDQFGAKYKEVSKESIEDSNFGSYEGFKNMVIQSKESGLLNEYFVSIINTMFKAAKTDFNKTNEVLYAIYIGNDKNENLSILVAFQSYFKSINYFDTDKIHDKTDIKEHYYNMDKLKHLFVEGYELNSKILTFVIGLLKIINKEKLNLTKIAGKTTNEKINIFETLSKCEVPTLEKNWARQLRNSSAHLNLNFNTKKDLFEGLKKHASGKQNRISITIDDMVLLVSINLLFFKYFHAAMTIFLDICFDKKTYYSKVSFLQEKLKETKKQ